MQVTYNTNNHPVRVRCNEFQNTIYNKYSYWLGSSKSGLLLTANDSEYHPDVRKAIREFLEEPLIKNYKGDYLRPSIRKPLTDMKGEPMELGCLFIQNWNRKLAICIVKSVSRTGAAQVDQLDDTYGTQLFTRPKPQYYLRVEPSMLTDDNKKHLERVFKHYPDCKEAYERIYGRS